MKWITVNKQSFFLFSLYLIFFIIRVPFAYLFRGNGILDEYYYKKVNLKSIVNKFVIEYF